MASLVAAMSRASTSGVRRAKAFLEPSGLLEFISGPHLYIHSEDEDCIPDKSVDLDGVNVVQLLQSLLDLALVGLDVDDEDEGVVLLNLLHGALGVQRVEDDLGGIELGSTGNRDTGVLGRPRELEGLWAVEGGRGANLAGLVKLFITCMSVCLRAKQREVIQGWIMGSVRETYGRALHDCLGSSVSCTQDLVSLRILGLQCDFENCQSVRSRSISGG